MSSENPRSTSTAATASRRLALLFVILALLMLVLAACQPTSPQEATPAPAEEATAAPAEEATTAPAEEATAAPAEEATTAPAEEATAAPAEEAMVGDPANGAVIFALGNGNGCGCHFNRDLGGPAGGNRFEGPFGVVYSANITPHPTTGIASYTDQQIANAVRLGKRGDGENLAPVMPRFATLSDKDALDLAAYLRTLDPLENAVPARELTIDVPDFTPAAPPPAESPTEPAARGLYLASIVRCGRCHTPLGPDGAPDMTKLLAGAPFEDTVAPNLTPDTATGLGEWSEEEIAAFLGTGVYADGLEAHKGMKSVVDRSLSKLGEEDLLAIAAFLKSLPPVENLPTPAQ